MPTALCMSSSMGATAVARAWRRATATWSSTMDVRTTPAPYQPPTLPCSCTCTYEGRSAHLHRRLGRGMLTTARSTATLASLVQPCSPMRCSPMRAECASLSCCSRVLVCGALMCCSRVLSCCSLVLVVPSCALVCCSRVLSCCSCAALVLLSCWCSRAALVCSLVLLCAAPVLLQGDGSRMRRPTTSLSSSRTSNTPSRTHTKSAVVPSLPA